jgi:hypothetical protein
MEAGCVWAAAHLSDRLRSPKRYPKANSYGGRNDQAIDDRSVDRAAMPKAAPDVFFGLYL